MSERQAKRLRKVLERMEEHETRLSACEFALEWDRAHELVGEREELERAQDHLKRARKRARSLEESLWTWKTAAITAIAVLAVTAFGIIIL